MVQPVRMATAWLCLGKGRASTSGPTGVLLGPDALRTGTREQYVYLLPVFIPSLQAGKIHILKPSENTGGRLGSIALLFREWSGSINLGSPRSLSEMQKPGTHLSPLNQDPWEFLCALLFQKLSFLKQSLRTVYYFVSRI